MVARKSSEKRVRLSLTPGDLKGPVSLCAASAICWQVFARFYRHTCCPYSHRWSPAAIDGSVDHFRLSHCEEDQLENCREVCQIHLMCPDTKPFAHEAVCEGSPKVWSGHLGSRTNGGLVGDGWRRTLQICFKRQRPCGEHGGAEMAPSASPFLHQNVSSEPASEKPAQRSKFSLCPNFIFYMCSQQCVCVCVLLRVPNDQFT